MKAASLLLFSLILMTACGRPLQDSSLPDPAPGVPLDLAETRAAQIDDLSYELRFSIPREQNDPISGDVTLEFDWKGNDRQPLIVDFVDLNGIRSVEVAGSDGVFKTANYRTIPEHVLVEPEALRPGTKNRIRIRFLAGDGPLNRQDDFLYTLFVPARAREAFPCFDQPDLKARYRLTLETPEDWEAVANGALLSETTSGEGAEARRTRTFVETEPISTYLFSFATGRFEIESETRNRREMRMFHRETDGERLAKNRAAIFDLHFQALDWLEDYTQIDYPFGKFDFVLIPAFQYGGMEHPGAILYRDSRLFLDESPTIDDLLGRAALIAHETAHMWFGDLVTMRWFNDVWLKEVFANFMAAKIAHPAFPEIDHDLSFLLRHYPTAYDVDRSAGTHPIRQPLGNLKDAGTLYGAIIYQKAPIVMRHLEELIGEDRLRQGLRTYLDTFRFGNADWSELIAILDGETDLDLAAWSKVWVSEAGRPTIRVEIESKEGRIENLTVRQSDPQNQGRVWPQKLTLMLDDERIEVELEEGHVQVPEAQGQPVPRRVLANGDGLGYGNFELSPEVLQALLERPADSDRPLVRAITWLSLWDALLNGHTEPKALLDSALRLLENEGNAQLTDRVLQDLRTVFWRALDSDGRLDVQQNLEEFLWNRLQEVDDSGVKMSYFRAYVDIAMGDEALRRVEQLWRGELDIPGLAISEQDQIDMAYALALREVEGWSAFLDEQQERIAQPDRQRQFEFVRPAVDADRQVRDQRFESLLAVENRQRETWVLETMRLLNHPLRAATAETYLMPSLKVLQEIQQTGDIFFPKRWLDALFSGQNSESAVQILIQFWQQHPDYPPHLRLKVLQSSDLLTRFWGQ